MSARLVGAQRGQALIETAAFLPLMILALLAIMYFSQFGVLQSRAVEAVRYATLVTNASAGTDVYSLPQMYAELAREAQASNPQLPGIPLTAYDCNGPNGAGVAAEHALIQNEGLPGAASATSTAPPYFQGTSPNTTIGSCTSTSIALPTTDLSVSNAFFVGQLTTIRADQSRPSFLAAPGATPPPAASEMGLLRAANPALALYCSPKFGSELAQSFSATPVMTDATHSAPAPSYLSYPAPTSNSARPGCS